MKKALSILILLLVTSLFFAASPSLDGRALVAEKGEFPSGFFAKTVGYLPGDIIIVTNPTTGESQEVMVIGSIDPSQGIAILLSPEAAEFLQIKKDSNTLVKLTKRSGDSDASATGMAVLSKGSEEPIPEVAETEAPKEDVIAVTPEETPIENEEEVVEPIESDIAELNEGEVIAEEVIDEPKLLTDEITTEEVPVDSPTTEEEVIAVDEIPEETVAVEEVIEEPEVTPEEEAVAIDEIPEESEAAPEEEAVAVDEIPEESEAAPEEEAVSVDEIPEESEVAPTEEAVAVDEIPEEDEAAPEEEAVAVDEIPEDTTEEFDSIVLVPTEENPPVETPVEPEVVPEETTVVISSDIIEAPAIEAPIETTSVDTLESGKYYVQIAVYAKQENIDEVVSTYGKKYPIIIKPRTNKKGYEVLVGPLSVDEYGTIVERFREYGFKDAFMKKGK